MKCLERLAVVSNAGNSCWEVMEITVRSLRLTGASKDQGISLLYWSGGAFKSILHVESIGMQCLTCVHPPTDSRTSLQDSKILSSWKFAIS